MTNLVKIKARLIHPLLTDNSYISALEDRGLVSSSEYSVSSDKRLMDLSVADLIVGTLLMAPNVSEGGFSVSVSEKSTLRELAESIYCKYGIRNPLRPIATFVNKI